MTSPPTEGGDQPGNENDDESDSEDEEEPKAGLTGPGKAIGAGYDTVFLVLDVLLFSSGWP
jgi:hypothetical protein